MSCVEVRNYFTLTWKIEHFRRFSSPPEESSFKSPVWKTETTEGSTMWRLVVNHSNSHLKFDLVRLSGELKDEMFKMSLLTSSGEVQLSSAFSYAFCYEIEKNKIFGETSHSFLPQDTLTLCCRIWQQKMKPGRCTLRSVLHEGNFVWSIDGFNFYSTFSKRIMHQQDTLLLAVVLYKGTKTTAKRRTHQVWVELLPYSGRWSTFVSCKIAIDDGCGHVVSNQYSNPKVSWVCDILLHAEKCQGSNLHFKFETLIAADMEYQQLRNPSDATSGSYNTLTDDILQLYKKRKLSDVTLNTEGKSFSVHKTILSTRSEVFYAMFEKDQMTEGRSGIVDIEDIDSETMNRLLVFLYSDSMEDLQWEEASALYYAADKYAVLPLKQKCIEILKAGVNTDKVYDALVLADKHSDEQLMKCAVDFISDNQKVVLSPKWKELEDNNLRLTSKITKELFLKKGTN